MRTVWIALDYGSREQADAWLEAFAVVLAHRPPPSGVRLGLKVGLELFTAAGPDAVKAWARSAPVFLDLKLHDIPKTVSGAVRAATSLGIDTLTLHIAGGTAMLAAARAAAGAVRLIGVTLLTSLDAGALAELGWGGEPAVWIDRWAALAAAQGLDGVVVSPWEVASIRQHFPGLATVVPGIRWGGTPAEDQRRVASPFTAVMHGATDLVVGRALTQSVDPERAWDELWQEISGALAKSGADGPKSS